METKILISLIESSGLNQTEFAAKFDLPKTRISEWVNGVRNPKISTLKSMADALGYEIVLSFELKKL